MSQFPYIRSLGRGRLGPQLSVSTDGNKGVSRAMFSCRNSGSSSELQAVGRTHFLLIVGVMFPLSC